MRLHVWFVALGLILGAGSAAADPKAKAKEHMAKAAEAYKAGQFADAQTELNAAYALDPQPQLLYSIGQIYVKLGQCGEAIMFYEQFLETRPSQNAADTATQAIEACKLTLARQSAATTPVDTEAPPGVPAEVAPPPSTPPPAVVQVDGPRPFYKDPIQIALVGGGTVALVASALLYSSARGQQADAGTAATYEESTQLFDDAASKRTTSVVFMVAGLGLVGGGVYYYLRTYRRPERATVTVVPTTEGASVHWSGRF